jgi:hypothetical protein
MRRRDRNSAYAVVLADLKGQRDDLDRMIRLIEARMAEPAGAEVAELPGLTVAASTASVPAKAAA